jgi:hypothetical protein
MKKEKIRNGLAALALAGALLYPAGNAQSQEKITKAELEQVALRNQPVQMQSPDSNGSIIFKKPSTSYQNTDGREESKIDWVYHGLEASYIALNAADVIFTYRALDKGAEEANPLLRGFVKSKPLTIAFKAGTTGLVLYANRKITKENKTVGYATLIALNLLYGYIVNNNYQVTMRVGLN